MDLGNRQSSEVDAALAAKEKPWDAIVLGAGISGLVAASILSRTRGARILVIDSYDKLGGNHIDISENGFTFDVGSFVFEDPSPFLDHFPELTQHYIPFQFSTAKLTRDGRTGRYPLSPKDDVIRKGPLVWCRILASLVWGRLTRDPDLGALAFAENRLGAYFVRESGLALYMRRFYGVDPSRIEAEFARKRMTFIANNASLKGVLKLFGSKSASPKKYRQLARPREGFSHLYGIARVGLENSGVTFRLDQTFKKFDFDRSSSKVTVVTESGSETSDRIVSTIPLNIALKLSNIEPDGKLQSVDLLSLFYSFNGLRGFKESILYNFDELGHWKRITMLSDVYGKHSGREFFTLEVNSQHVGHDVLVADADFREHMNSRGLFQGGLLLEAHRKLDGAYPVYLEGATAAAAEAVLTLKRRGILSFGRQGGFDYQPTARRSAVVASEALASFPEGKN